LYSLAAWVNHADLKPANTFEAWVPDRRDRSRGRVVHYLLDFGKALGAMARIDGRLETGIATIRDAERMLVEHAVTGAPLPWASLGPYPDLRGLGYIESEHFDPSAWTPHWPWLPFEKADRFDKLWGARLVASFTPAQIRAAVLAARYSDPRTVDHLVRVLLERQRKVLEHAFRGAAPLERFELRASTLCFVDLWTRHRLGGRPAAYLAAGRPAVAKRDGTVCVSDLPRVRPARIEILVARPEHVLLPVRVHLDARRVIAVERL
jgi:hypothetical protein